MFVENFILYTYEKNFDDNIIIVISLGTNLIHDFTAVTFSVKLAFFREKCRFSWNPWFFV